MPKPTKLKYKTFFEGQKFAFYFLSRFRLLMFFSKIVKKSVPPTDLRLVGWAHKKLSSQFVFGPVNSTWPWPRVNKRPNMYETLRQPNFLGRLPNKSVFPAQQYVLITLFAPPHNATFCFNIIIMTMRTKTASHMDVAPNKWMDGIEQSTY